jgi:hypothetical protein
LIDGTSEIIFKAEYQLNKNNYRPLYRTGMFILWSLRTIKLHIFGLGGFSLLLIVAFLTAAFFSKDYRWLFFSIGIGIFLFLSSVLVVAYAQYLFNGFKERQQKDFQHQLRLKLSELQTHLDSRYDAKMNKAYQELSQLFKYSVQQTTKELKGLREPLEKFRKDSREASENSQKALEKLRKDSREASKNSQKALAAHQQILSKSNFLNAGIYQKFNRYLQNEHIQKILDFWRPALSLEDISKKSLGYLAHRICQIEDNCSGRLATTIQDAVLRTLIAQSIKDNTLEILEIGSLFGIGLAIIYDNCRGRFDRIHLTAIDPLDGYYNNSAYDKGTNAPVNSSLFNHNMRVADIPKKDVTLIKVLSNDEQAQDVSRKRSYNILIIDGDHSYEGVKFDFDHYRHMVKHEGYIIIDDYNTDRWPDVTEFVDREVKIKPDIKLIGNDWRTVVFQVRNR